jgi:hypothetical protein
MKAVDPAGSHGLLDASTQICSSGPERIEDAGRLSKLPADSPNATSARTRST